MFFLEGNVGTGKSTFLNHLEKTNLSVIYEPVSEWTDMTNSNGKNLLEEFYGNQKRWAYTFQSIAFRTRIKNLKNCGPNTIVERSIFTDKNVFAKTCHECNNMTEIEWSDYNSWFNWLADEFAVKPKGYIYLRAKPEVSYERIKKRSRSGEETIPFEYLNELNKKHDDWLMDEPNVLVLDVNDDFEKNDKLLLEMIEIVTKFITV